jgi:DNA mismatch endonuclease (patch repair protein)
MSRIRSKSTRPEQAVVQIVRSLGFRHETNVKSLPGSPDVVIRRHRLAIFVHGCFWHRHPGCTLAYSPKSRTTFWREKFDANVRRDRRSSRRLRALGWRVMTVWECRLERPDAIRVRILRLTTTPPRTHSDACGSRRRA